MVAVVAVATYHQTLVAQVAVVRLVHHQQAEALQEQRTEVAVAVVAQVAVRKVVLAVLVVAV